MSFLKYLKFIIIIIVNSTPAPKKIEAFKSVVQKLPKTNYDNLKYLIKFLAKIVENSDKTKMTSSNMGICFGVSLLSGSNPLNSALSSNPLENITNKNIDMATATNVFDFILNNHQDLLPGDINFVTSNIKSKPTFYNSNPSIYNSLGRSTHVPSQVNEFQNQTSKTINNSNNYNEQNTQLNASSDTISISSASNSPFVKQSNNLNNNGSPSLQNSNSTISASSISTSNNIVNMNRHIKKNSMDKMDIKFIDNENTGSMAKATSSALE